MEAQALKQILNKATFFIDSFDQSVDHATAKILEAEGWQIIGMHNSRNDNPVLRFENQDTFQRFNFEVTKDFNRMFPGAFNVPSKPDFAMYRKPVELNWQLITENGKYSCD